MPEKPKRTRKTLAEVLGVGGKEDTEETPTSPIRAAVASLADSPCVVCGTAVPENRCPTCGKQLRDDP